MKYRVEDNKFHKGNNSDKKHYWLTPPDLYKKLNNEFEFDFDPCPYPLPENFNGLTNDWGQSNYVNPPFGTISQDPTIHLPTGLYGKKKGITAWVRKAIAENKKGKQVVLVYPLPKWLFMLLELKIEIRNLGDVKWCATEDGTPGKGTGKDIACFILNNAPN